MENLTAAIEEKLNASLEVNSLFNGEVSGRTFPVRTFLNVPRSNEILYLFILAAKTIFLRHGIYKIISPNAASCLLLTLTSFKIAFPGRLMLDVPLIWACWYLFFTNTSNLTVTDVIHGRERFVPADMIRENYKLTILGVLPVLFSDSAAEFIIDFFCIFLIAILIINVTRGRDILEDDGSIVVMTILIPLLVLEVVFKAYGLIFISTIFYIMTLVFIVMAYCEGKILLFIGGLAMLAFCVYKNFRLGILFEERQEEN